MAELWRRKESLRAMDSKLRSRQIDELCVQLIPHKDANELSPYLSAIIMDENNDCLINEMEIKGGQCNLDSAVMNAVLKSNAKRMHDNGVVLEVIRLAMQLNQYDVFEE